jgi:hypothetical protein
MASDGYGFELPLLLFGGFRAIIDELHTELAHRGHPDLRPAHGFAMQAVGLGGTTASAMIFSEIRAKWAAELGANKLAELEASLRAMVPGEIFRFDVPGWFGAGDRTARRRFLLLS